MALVIGKGVVYDGGTIRKIENKQEAVKAEVKTAKEAEAKATEAVQVPATAETPDLPQKKAAAPRKRAKRGVKAAVKETPAEGK